MSILYPVPVVRLIIEDSQGCVLILQRPKGAAGEGGWCLPGGKIDYGQTIEEAVTAELREETGLTCRSLAFLFFQDSLPLEAGGMHCINFYFRCEADGRLRTNHESCAHAWLSRNNLRDYALLFGHEEGLRRYWDSHRR